MLSLRAIYLLQLIPNSRTDKKQHFAEKVSAVDKLLAMDKKPESSSDA